MPLRLRSNQTKLPIAPRGVGMNPKSALRSSLLSVGSTTVSGEASLSVAGIVVGGTCEKVGTKPASVGEEVFTVT